MLSDTVELMQVACYDFETSASASNLQGLLNVNVDVLCPTGTVVQYLKEQLKLLVKIKT